MSLLATVQTRDSWKDEARRILEYCKRLKYTDPKLCMQILIDILDQVLRRLPRESVS